jgi:hypothetical protein
MLYFDEDYERAIKIGELVGIHSVVTENVGSIRDFLKTRINNYELVCVREGKTDYLENIVPCLEEILHMKKYQKTFHVMGKKPEEGETTVVGALIEYMENFTR